MEQLAAIAVIVIIICIICNVNNKKKQKEAQREAIRRKEIERQQKERDTANKIEKAKRILQEDNFKKIYKYINEANREYVATPSASKNVYDCYPYGQFTIHEDQIVCLYFTLKIDSGFDLTSDFSTLVFAEHGINDITKEECDVYAYAFGLTDAYEYAGKDKVCISKSFWNATKSVNDIEEIYNGELD